MSVRHFDGVDDVLSVGALSPSFTGDGTIAVIWRGSDGSNHGIMDAEDSGGFQRWSFIAVSGDETYFSCFGFSALHPWSADEWYLSIMTKPSGGSTVRRHSMPFSTGVWTHADRSSVGDNAGSAATINFGHNATDNFWLEGEIAAAGIWRGVQLSDAECESMEADLLSWLALSPDGLWALNQESVSDPVIDLTGNGHDQVAIVGTSILTGDDPPGFDFSLVTDTHFYRDGGVWVPTTRHVRQAGAWVTL